MWKENEKEYIGKYADRGNNRQWEISWKKSQFGENQIEI